MKRPFLLACVFLYAIRIDAQSFNSNSFLLKSDFQTGIYPHSVLAADFNGDGKTDLFIARGSSSVVSVLTNTSSGGQISFAPQSDFPGSGNDAEGSAVADIDGDGKPDVVVANGIAIGDSSGSVFRNTSSGMTISFAAKINFKSDAGPYSVALGDLDGDGKADLAIAANGGTKITLYRNTSTPGNISFATRVDISGFTNPYGIAIGDLDNDGKAEIVVATQGSASNLYVLKNNSVSGAIIFSTPNILTPMAGAFTVTISDLDGDGKADIIAPAAGLNGVVVLRNTSSGGLLSFAGAQNIPSGNYPVHVIAKDLDGDGKSDLITANRSDNSVSVLRNTSTSGFISFDTKMDFGVGQDPFFVASGDLDGDGKPEIISANTSSDFISVLRNMTGSNAAPVIVDISPKKGISGSHIKIAGGHFNGTTSVRFGGVDAASYSVDSDSVITAVVGMGASGTVSVTTAFGTALDSNFVFDGPLISSFNPVIGVSGSSITINGSNFKAVHSVTFGGVPVISFVVNDSTKITAILGNGASGLVSVTTDSGTATSPGFGYGAVPVITSFSPSVGPVGSTVVISGLNFDNRADSNIVFFGAVRAKVISSTNTQLQVIVPAGATYESISVTTNKLTAYSSGFFIVNFLSDSDTLSLNSFKPAGDFACGNYPFDVIVHDMDNDGKPDVLTVNSNDYTISVLQNNSTRGNISFKTKKDFSTGPSPRKIVASDLNGDGLPDLVVTNFNDGNAASISIYQNTTVNHLITFSQLADIPTGNGSFGLGIADLDGDGKPDVVVMSANSGWFTIFRNISLTTGAIRFASGQNITAMYNANELVIADLDQDGRPDIVTSNFSANTLAVYRNLSTAGNMILDNPLVFPTGSNPSYLAAGDLNGDGKLDIAVQNYNSSITFYRNFSTPGYIQLANRVDSTMAKTNIGFGDLNGDGLPDLTAGGSLDGVYTAVENKYTGASDFSFGKALNFTTGNYDVYGAIGDLDGDGKPDLIAANTLTNTVSVLRNTVGGPSIISLSDTVAKTGQTIIITGKRLSNVFGVTFGGMPAASFQVLSSTQISAVVGSGSNGNVSVGNDIGYATFSGFHFIPQILVHGTTTICEHSEVILESTSSVNNQWYRDGVLMDGETDRFFHAKTGGVYFVQTTINDITSRSDSTITIFVRTVPVPVISKNSENILVSGDTTGNQWYLNGSAIAGATSQKYTPALSGVYTVTSTSGDCVSDMSAGFIISMNNVVDLGEGQYIKIYPNPVKDKLILKYLINDLDGAAIAISDFQGRQMLTYQNLPAGGMTIDLSTLPEGMYFLKVYDSKTKATGTIRFYKLK